MELRYWESDARLAPWRHQHHVAARTGDALAASAGPASTFLSREGKMTDDIESLKDQIRQLRSALLSMVYEKDGKWFSGIKEDSDVSEEVALALRMSEPPRS
jgi:hypothetical protein